MAMYFPSSHHQSHHGDLKAWHPSVLWWRSFNPSEGFWIWRRSWRKTFRRVKKM